MAVTMPPRPSRLSVTSPLVIASPRHGVGMTPPDSGRLKSRSAHCWPGVLGIVLLLNGFLTKVAFKWTIGVIALGGRPPAHLLGSIGDQAGGRPPLLVTMWGKGYRNPGGPGDEIDPD
jgi:hypothetical protein